MSASTSNKTPAGTIAVDIMSLFTAINTKLDTLARDIAQKADMSTLTQLTQKVTELEIHGSNNAQLAAQGVDELRSQIGFMGWKIVGAIALGTLSVLAQVVLAIFGIHH